MGSTPLSREATLYLHDDAKYDKHVPCVVIVLCTSMSCVYYVMSCHVT